MKRDYIEFLSKEESDYINSHPEEYTFIPLPSSPEGNGKRISDLVIDWTEDQMHQLIAESETQKHARNEYARSICNEALTRRGDAPIF